MGSSNDWVWSNDWISLNNCFSPKRIITILYRNTSGKKIMGKTSEQSSAHERCSYSLDCQKSAQGQALRLIRMRLEEVEIAESRFTALMKVGRVAPFLESGLGAMNGSSRKRLRQIDRVTAANQVQLLQEHQAIRAELVAFSCHLSPGNRLCRRLPRYEGENSSHKSCPELMDAENSERLNKALPLALSLSGQSLATMNRRTEVHLLMNPKVTS